MKKRELSELRRRAEEILAENPVQSPGQITEADYLKMLHEMSVCRIELELQTEELDQSREQTNEKTRELEQLTDLHTRFITHYVKHRSS